MDYWPFNDGDRFPDEMWNFIEVDGGSTTPEKHFIRVLWFHFDFMNGGLAQVMYNLKVAFGHDPEEYAQSFEELGLQPLATVVRIANERDDANECLCGKSGKELNDVYSAIALGIPMTCKDRFAEYLPPIVEGAWSHVDWVEKAALKYARENFSAFGDFVQAYREATSS